MNEALEMIEKENFQLALLDENMPGISGLEAIPMIKNIDSAIKIGLFKARQFLHRGFRRKCKYAAHYLNDECVG